MCRDLQKSNPRGLGATLSALRTFLNLGEVPRELAGKPHPAKHHASLWRGARRQDRDSLPSQREPGEQFRNRVVVLSTEDHHQRETADRAILEGLKLGTVIGVVYKDVN